MDRELDGLLSGSGSEINLLAVSRVKRMGSMSTVEERVEGTKEPCALVYTLRGKR